MANGPKYYQSLVIVCLSKKIALEGDVVLLCDSLFFFVNLCGITFSSYFTKKYKEPQNAVQLLLYYSKREEQYHNF